MVEIPENVIEAAQAGQDTTKNQFIPGGIPASVQIAQWADESGWGAKYTGTWNCFGVKAEGDQPFTPCTTHEIVDGQRVEVVQNFLNYDSLIDAFNAHAMLLATSARYANARALLPDVTKFVEAMAPIYATEGQLPGDPYAATLLDIIRVHNLEQYDS
jgi:flagellum-specific peptidoglycan hydrolase FlgJ